jgi:hypothetical protein
MPSNRATGQAPGSNDVGLGSATAKENSQYGVPAYAFDATSFDQGESAGNPNGLTQIAKDAQNEQLTIQRINAAGAVITADGAAHPIGQIRLKLSDSEGQTLRIGRVHYADASTGAAKVAWLLRSAALADPPGFGSNGADDLFLGGGSGGAGILPALLLQSVQGDYITAWPAIPLAVTSITSSGTTATVTTAAPHGIAIGKTANVNIAGATPAGYNGTFVAAATTSTAFTYTLGSSLANPATGTITYQADVYLAKPWKLRNSRAAETGADGTAYTLSYGAGANANNVRRTKTGTSGPGDGLTETEAVAPEWLAGDILYAQPAATGVLDGNGNPITLLLAGESRNWTAIAS